MPEKDENEEIIPEREYKHVQEELITEKMEKMTFESGKSFCFCAVFKHHSFIHHSMLMRNLTKNWMKKTGPSQGDIARSRDPTFAYFEILQSRENFY